MAGRRYTVDGRLGALIVRGAQLKADVAEAVTKATLDLSTSEVTQLDLTIADPDLKLAASGLFTPGRPDQPGSPVDYGDLKLEVRRVTVGPGPGGPSLHVVARDLGAYKLKRAKGPHVRGNASPTDAAALDAKGTGLKFVGEPSAKRPTVAREEDENAWESLGRLAEELGYLRFVAAGTLYFGRPTWLTERAGRTHVLRWNGAATDPRIREIPECTRSGDDEQAVASVSAQLYGDLGDDYLPGDRLTVLGVPSFDGDYLVDKVTIELDEVSPVSVSASTAVNPEPKPPTEDTDDDSDSAASSSSPAAAAAGGPTPSTGSGTAEAFVKVALGQAGDRYVFGAEARPADPDPDAFDCSELVEWALARVGVKFVDGSQAQINRATPISLQEGVRTRGALLWTPGHIAISLGNGRTIEARGRKYGVTEANAIGRFRKAGLVPGLRYR